MYYYLYLATVLLLNYIHTLSLFIHRNPIVWNRPLLCRVTSPIVKSRLPYCEESSPLLCRVVCAIIHWQLVHCRVRLLTVEWVKLSWILFTLNSDLFEDYLTLSFLIFWHTMICNSPKIKSHFIKCWDIIPTKTVLWICWTKYPPTNPLSVSHASPHEEIRISFKKKVNRLTKTRIDFTDITK